MLPAARSGSALHDGLLFILEMPPVTVRTVQGMACVPSGQAPAWPLSSDRSVRRGSRVKRDFACTSTRHVWPVFVALRSQSRLRLEGRTRTLSGPSPDLSPARTVASPADTISARCGLAAAAFSSRVFVPPDRRLIAESQGCQCSVVQAPRVMAVVLSACGGNCPVVGSLSGGCRNSGNRRQLRI